MGQRSLAPHMVSVAPSHSPTSLLLRPPFAGVQAACNGFGDLTHSLLCYRCHASFRPTWGLGPDIRNLLQRPSLSFESVAATSEKTRAEGSGEQDLRSSSPPPPSV